jgi:hypothetical protein
MNVTKYNCIFLDIEPLADNCLPFNIPTVGEEFRLELEIKPTDTVVNDASIIRFTSTTDDTGSLGDEIPSLYFRAGTTKLEVVADVSGNNQDSTVTPDANNLALNTWTHVKIESVSNGDGDIIYSVEVGGVRIRTTKNTAAQAFNEVSICFSDSFHDAADAQVRHVSMTTGATSATAAVYYINKYGFTIDGN